MRVMPELKPDQIGTGRIWLCATPREALDLLRDGEEGYWPVYIVLRASRASRPDAPKFNLRLIWARGDFNAAACDEPSLRAHFEKDFPGLKHFPNSGSRRITIAEHLSPAEAVKAAKSALDTMSAAIRTRPH